jgi:membrane protein DedA with SNARE-associated domain
MCPPRVQVCFRSRPEDCRRVLASLASSITQFVGDRGVYAVFMLMMIDAVFPAGSELVMVYAGALAAGAFAGERVAVVGAHLHSGLGAFVTVVAVGTFGYLIGAVIGWAIGSRAGRPFVVRHGRLFHLGPETLAHADAWFARHGTRAVFWGRLTPVVRSFVSIPAGIQRMPLGPYTNLTLLGSFLWCLVFAGIGWAIGSSYERFNTAFDYVSFAVVALLVGGFAMRGLRRRAARDRRRRTEVDHP